MTRALALTAILAACGGPPAAPAESPERGPVGEETHSPATDAAPIGGTCAPPASAADGGPLGLASLSAAGDIDGKPGEERITFDADGTLTAGSLSIRLEPPPSNEYFWAHQAVLRAVVLDSAKKLVAIHLGVPTGEGEDPPNIERLFIARRGRLVKVFDQVVGVYTPTDLAFPGDGTLRYVEQGWEACERAHHPAAPVAKQEVVYRLNRAGTAMVEWRRIDTREKQACDQLSACPFVYAVGADGGATRVGEILRDLRGARAYSLQSLPMPRGTVRIRLAEEKSEVTYLDEVLVEAGGVEQHPLACRGAPVPAYCAADQVPFVMHRGDTLDLAFEPAEGDDVTLFARGYYVPLE